MNDALTRTAQQVPGRARLERRACGQSKRAKDAPPCSNRSGCVAIAILDNLGYA